MDAMQTATLMRIFVDEGERYHKKPLFMAIVDELRDRGFGGATVLRGIEGFGSHERVHSMRVIDSASSLPILIEVAETEEKIRETVPKLREMIPDGLITLERIQMRILCAKR
ncbi:MAG TPA: DUF190 domain-containing protein [Candidatus Tumulicola sp.]|jgi:hypothetical protein